MNDSQSKASSRIRETGDPLVAWALRRTEVLTEGARSAGACTAQVTQRRQAHDVYPWCSEHGAMNRIGNKVWRCLAEGCNVGCLYPVPYDMTVLL